MNYSYYGKEQIRDISFYCVLDYVDDIDHFHNAEIEMKYERARSLETFDGFEEWKNKWNRLSDEK